ncbi:MAG TPA: hypothetical protein PLG22_11780, partial [Kiritimatiellia bacterium]|nr:hypothetical protein [Kiritimatiellia bacterium]
PLDATLVEVADAAGDAPRAGARHTLAGGQGTLEIPGTVRLRAEAPGRAPLTLSPVLDDPELIGMVIRLGDADLLDWATFERLRARLAALELTFRLVPACLRGEAAVTPSSLAGAADTAPSTIFRKTL